jgi:hypothetical protein
VILLIIGIIISRGWLNDGYPIGTDAMAGPPVSWYLEKELSALHFFPYHNPYWYLGASLATHPLPIYYLYILASGISNYATAVKIVHLTFFLLSSLTMYALTLRKTNCNLAAFVSALLYTYNPFVLVEFVFEGHGALLMGYFLTPLVFLSFDYLLSTGHMANVGISALLLAATILTHPQVVLLIGPLVVTYALYRLIASLSINVSRSKTMLFITIPRHAIGLMLKRAKLLLLSFLLALGLSAFWWLLFLFLRKETLMTVFSLDDISYLATPVGILTLRPPSTNYPSIEFNNSNPLYIQVFQLSLIVPVLLGIVFGRKKGDSVFFASSALIFSLIALGTQLPLYGFLFMHVPFFNSIRTAARFMFTISFLFAVLAGLGIAGLKRHLGKSRLILVLIFSFLIVNNIWVDSQNGFRTFELPPEWDYVIKWLNAQPDGTYRIAMPPHKAWIYSPEFGSVLNPMFWTQLHGKESVGGNIPSDAPIHIGIILEQLFWYPQSLPIDSKRWLDYFNVKYIVVDRFDKASTLSLRLPSDYLEPSSWTWAEGTTTANLSSVSRTSEGRSNLLRIHYNFSNPYRDWLIIATSIGQQSLSNKSVLLLRFFLEDNQPDLYMSVDIIDSRGARFGVDLYPNMTAGWHELRVPLNELKLRYSKVNASLDLRLARWLWLGIAEKANFNIPHIFDIYFDTIAITEATDTSGVKRLWRGENLEIYENENPYPRIFKLLFETKSNINTSNPQAWVWAEGTAPRILIQKNLTVNDYPGTYLESSYNFVQPYREWLNLAINIQNIRLRGDEFLNFTYYLPNDVSGIIFGFDMLDEQGGRYGINIIPETRRGVHQILIPLSLFLHRYSRIDTPVSPEWERIRWFWFGVAEASEFYVERRFSVYILNVTFMSVQVEEVEFRRTGPAAYEVEFRSEKPAYLVLSTAYSNRWTAVTSTGEHISSKCILGALNGFYLPPGMYGIKIYLEDHPAANAGRVISTFSLLGAVFTLLPKGIRTRSIAVIKSAFRRRD